MKLKVRPEDFQVEELVRLQLNPHGKYRIYRLEKRLWNTLDVLDVLGRKYRLGNLQRAGLKDRYSHSIQYVSAVGAGPEEIQEKNFRLKLIGRSSTPVTREIMTGNRFRIVIRELKPEETATINKNLPAVLKWGFPNYYDEQRFGASRHGEGFIAYKLILKHYNGALKLYLATTSGYDDAATRRLKTALLEHWTDWANCYRIAQQSRAGVAREFLPVLNSLMQKPRDFERALRAIRRDYLEMFLNSYQSYLWNETLRELLISFGVPTVSVPYSGGELLFYRQLNPKAREFFTRHEIPAASDKTEVTSERISRVLNTVLLREGLTLRDMRLELRIPGVFFKPYLRPGIVFPEKLTVSAPAEDELYPKHQKLTLSFILPPGSYATILVKRLLLEDSREFSGPVPDTCPS